MPINKLVRDLDTAVADIESGSAIYVGGFGGAGHPTMLLNALARRGLKGLTVISNNAGTGSEGLAALLASGAVRKICCSYPKSSGSYVFDELYARGEIELELIPQGTLSERIRAAGAGIGGFYTPTGAGTALTEGREVRVIGTREFVFEEPLPADYALISARAADRWGNLIYDKSARNFGPTMAMGASTTLVEVDAVVALGDLDPESVVTPSIFVDRVVLRPQ